MVRRVVEDWLRNQLQPKNLILFFLGKYTKLNLSQNSGAKFGGDHLLEENVDLGVEVVEFDVAAAQTALAHVALRDWVKWGKFQTENKNECLIMRGGFFLFILR